MSTQRRIDWEWLHDLAWYDVASDAHDSGLIDPYERMASEWTFAIVCFGWCLHDAGYAAACERRGYAMGRADALR